MYLIANGCSHTAGAEIEYLTQDSCYNKAWPQHLANKLNIEIINLARSGASCKRIIRTTIDCLGNLFLKGIKPNELFVIVVWSGPYRTEIYQDILKNDELWEGWLPLCVGNDEQYKKYYSRAVYQYYKNWVAVALTPKAANIEYYNNIILLQGYLKSLKIKYLFWRACSTTLDKMNIPLAIQIDRKYFSSVHDDGSNYLTLLKNAGYKFSFENATHFGEDGHIFFANFLYKVLEKTYGILE